MRVLEKLSRKISHFFIQAMVLLIGCIMIVFSNIIKLSPSGLVFNLKNSISPNIYLFLLGIMLIFTSVMLLLIQVYFENRPNKRNQEVIKQAKEEIANIEKQKTIRIEEEYIRKIREKDKQIEIYDNDLKKAFMTIQGLKRKVNNTDVLDFENPENHKLRLRLEIKSLSGTQRRILTIIYSDDFQKKEILVDELYKKYVQRFPKKNERHRLHQIASKSELQYRVQSLYYKGLIEIQSKKSERKTWILMADFVKNLALEYPDLFGVS